MRLSRVSEIIGSPPSNADPRQQSRYAVDLGDFLLRAKREADAIQIYRDAAARTEAELPRQRIIDHADLIEARELLPLCNQWKTHQPDLAINCFASALRRSAKTDAELAGDAFAGWLYVEAHTDQLTKEALSEIGAVWSDPIVGDVQNFWNNPLDGFHPSSYWVGKPQRSGSIAELGAKACKKVELTALQDPARAIACLERFLDPNRKCWRGLCIHSTVTPRTMKSPVHCLCTVTPGIVCAHS